MTTATADAGGLLGLGPAGTVSLGSLMLVAAASVAVTMLRRRRIHRDLLARVGVRLAAVVAAPAPPDEPRRPAP
jgi:hypothetical protein